MIANRFPQPFTASADPFGTNPHENCQFFSIDTPGKRPSPLGSIW